MLKQSLTYHLASIADDGVGIAQKLFESRFGFDVYELRVLRLVRDTPGVTFTDLARLTKFERSATSRILSRLIKSGLVQRRNSEADARVFSLTVTPEGRALCRRADPLSLELERLMLAPLSEAEREAFAGMIDRVLEWVDGGYQDEVRRRFPQELGAGRKMARRGK